eukprot:4136049-Prymnesium_polylepis.1
MPASPMLFCTCGERIARLVYCVAPRCMGEIRAGLVLLVPPCPRSLERGRAHPVHGHGGLAHWLRHRLLAPGGQPSAHALAEHVLSPPQLGRQCPHAVITRALEESVAIVEALAEVEIGRIDLAQPNLDQDILWAANSLAPIEGSNVEGRAHDNEQLALREVGLAELEEAAREGLAEESDVGFHERAILARQCRPAIHRIRAVRDGVPDLLDRHWTSRARDHLAALVESGQSRARLEAVDVLRVAAEQHPALVQLGDEVVHWRGRERVGPHLVGERVECLWTVAKVIEGKDRLGLGQVILLEVVVQPSSRCAKVRDARRSGNSGAAHYDDFLAVVVFDVLGDALDAKRF